MRLPDTDTLQRVYGETEKSGRRFESLGENFKKCFGKEEAEFFSSPGRTEIIGNHTDHNGGKILAASINMDTIGAALPNDSNMIEIVSEGYRDKIVVDITRVDDVPQNQGTLSLVAGMVKAIQEFGFQVSGFQAYVSTEVISSAGVSSSASFEMLFCAIVNHFFNDNKMSCLDCAKIGQYGENHYWNKASGLMDQLACAAGGAIALDFSTEKVYEKIDFSFEDYGYDMVIVNTGKGHADLSDEYSQVPQEMKTVAKCLGHTLLCEGSLDELVKNIPEIEKKVNNDRAILRAVHFYEENKRVENIISAINEKKGDVLLNIVSESGKSSWELLQNCYSLANFKEQKVTLCLALTQLFLNEKKDGCCRVHGGGFAGVILGVIPKKHTKEYMEYMSGYVGEENVYAMKIRDTGAVHLG